MIGVWFGDCGMSESCRKLQMLLKKILFKSNQTIFLAINECRSCATPFLEMDGAKEGPEAAGKSGPRRDSAAVFGLFFDTHNIGHAHTNTMTLLAGVGGVGGGGGTIPIHSGKPATFRVIRPGYAGQEYEIPYAKIFQPTVFGQLLWMHPSESVSCVCDHMVEAGSLFLACWLIRSLLLCCSHRLPFVIDDVRSRNLSATTFLGNETQHTTLSYASHGTTGDPQLLFDRFCDCQSSRNHLL